MPPSDRPTPPLNADERATLASWLDFYRATLASKCNGLDEIQLRTASVPPSPLTVLGLVQHMAEVERNWFQRVVGGLDVPPVYGEESGDVEIAVLRRRRADADALVGEPDMHGVGVGGRVHGDRRYTELLAGAEHPERDLAAVGDEDFIEHGAGLPPSLTR